MGKENENPQHPSALSSPDVQSFTESLKRSREQKDLRRKFLARRRSLNSRRLSSVPVAKRVSSVLPNQEFVLELAQGGGVDEEDTLEIKFHQEQIQKQLEKEEEIQKEKVRKNVEEEETDEFVLRLRLEEDEEDKDEDKTVDKDKEKADDVKNTHNVDVSIKEQTEHGNDGDDEKSRRNSDHTFSSKESGSSNSHTLHSNATTAGGTSVEELFDGLMTSSARKNKEHKSDASSSLDSSKIATDTTTTSTITSNNNNEEINCDVSRKSLTNASLQNSRLSASASTDAGSSSVDSLFQGLMSKEIVAMSSSLPSMASVNSQSPRKRKDSSSFSQTPASTKSKRRRMSISVEKKTRRPSFANDTKASPSPPSPILRDNDDSSLRELALDVSYLVDSSETPNSAPKSKDGANGADHLNLLVDSLRSSNDIERDPDLSTTTTPNSTKKLNNNDSDPSLSVSPKVTITTTTPNSQNSNNDEVDLSDLLSYRSLSSKKSETNESRLAMSWSSSPLFSSNTKSPTTTPLHIQIQKSSKTTPLNENEVSNEQATPPDEQTSPPEDQPTQTPVARTPSPRDTVTTLSKPRSILRSNRQKTPKDLSQTIAGPKVVFGSPEAAEFLTENPSTQITPIPPKAVREMYRIPENDLSEEDSADMELEGDTMELEEEIGDLLEGISSHSSSYTYSPSSNSGCQPQTRDNHNKNCPEENTMELEVDMQELLGKVSPAISSSSSPYTPKPNTTGDVAADVDQSMEIEMVGKRLNFEPTAISTSAAAPNTTENNTVELEGSIGDLLANHATTTDTLLETNTATMELEGCLGDLLDKHSTTNSMATTNDLSEEEGDYLNKHTIDTNMNAVSNENTVELEGTISALLANAVDVGKQNETKGGLVDATAPLERDVMSLLNGAMSPNLAGTISSSPRTPKATDTDTNTSSMDMTTTAMPIEASFADSVGNNMAISSPKSINNSLTSSSFSSSASNKVMASQSEVDDILQSATEAVSSIKKENPFGSIENIPEDFVEAVCNEIDEKTYFVDIDHILPDLPAKCLEQLHALKEVILEQVLDEWSQWEDEVSEALVKKYDEMEHEIAAEESQLKYMMDAMNQAHEELSDYNKEAVKRARRRSFLRRKTEEAETMADIERMEAELAQEELLVLELKKEVASRSRTIEVLLEENSLHKLVLEKTELAEKARTAATSAEGIVSWDLGGGSPSKVIARFPTFLSSKVTMDLSSDTVTVTPLSPEERNALRRHFNGQVQSIRSDKLWFVDWRIRRLEMTFRELTRLQRRHSFTVKVDDDDTLSIHIQCQGVEATFGIRTSTYPFAPMNLTLDSLSKRQRSVVGALSQRLLSSAKPGFNYLSRACDILFTFLSSQDDKAEMKSPSLRIS